MRTAIIRSTRTRLETVQRFLPSNYQAEEVQPGVILIRGEDVAGWTLDSYVLPRLASGLIYARETTGGHDPLNPI